MRRTLALTCLVLLVATQARAQQQADRTRTIATKAGMEVKIGGLMRYDKRCQPLSPPSMAVLAAPQNGAVSTRPGTEIAGMGFGGANCRGREVSGLLVYYQPKPGFHGEDHVQYQAEYTTGAILNTITIKVE